MLRNYIITAFRNLKRNKVNTLINTIGLTLGITCSMVLFLVVRYELAFNKHYDDSDRIYRVVTQKGTLDNMFIGASMQFPFVDAFKNEFPNIKDVTFVHNNTPPPSFYVEKDGERQRFQESSQHFAFVNENYFNVFNAQWIAGNPETALSQVNSIVMTQNMAEKFFGRTDVVGELINFNQEKALLITGVIENYPQTTDLPIDLYVPMEASTSFLDQRDAWGADYGSVNCYVKLPEGITQQDMESRLVGFDKKYHSQESLVNGKRLLQPLSDLHYNEDLSNYAGRTISLSTLWAMGIIGLLLLLAACINFINLNTALAVRRSKEVGIRKVLGSRRKQLVFQFMGETFLVTFIALLISFGGIELALIKLKDYLEYDLQLNILKDGQATLFLATIFIFSVVFSGLYPSLVLASYKPIAAIRNKITAEKHGRISLRKVLVTTQLMISQALIVCTVIVIQQMDYFYNSPLGLDKDAIIEVRVPSGERQNHQLFKNRALQIPGVESMTLTNSGAISSSVWFGSYSLTLDGEVIENGSEIKFVDEDFLDTYGVELLFGENVQEREGNHKFMVNEQLLIEIGIENYADVIGKPFSYWGRKGTIGGVVANYNTKSLHGTMEPLVMLHETGYAWTALKFNAKDVKPLLAHLERVYKDIFPERDFKPRFLDETIENFYAEEQKASTLFQIASGIAILIGCIGMIGLISYIASQKVKEVGIRKVLGASVANILALFSRQFLGLTLIGFVIAAPLAYYVMNSWLQSFVNKISIGADVFGMSLLITALLVVLSVGIRAYKSAVVNPTKSLRSE